MDPIVAPYLAASKQIIQGVTLSRVKGQLIGNCDHIRESLDAAPSEHQAEVAPILERTARHRQEAFELMEQYNPKRAWFWVEGRKAPKGTQERLPPPSRPLSVISDVALDAAYAEMAADEDYEREALEWIEGFVGETLE